MYRIGMLSATGTGKKRTIPALKESRRCAVTVVHGRDSSKLDEIAAMDTGISVTTDVEQFKAWSSKYDVVFVGSPPFLHIEHLKVALDLGKPVICEKPLCSTREDFDRIIKMINEKHPPIMIAHHLRHQEATQEIQAIVNELGTSQVSSASLQWSFPMNHAAPSGVWKLDPQRGGSNALFDAGVHAIDLAQMLFGNPLRVLASGKHQRSSATFDSVTALLEYESFTAAITASQAGSTGANDLLINFVDRSIRAPGMLGEKSLDTLRIVSAQGEEERSYEQSNLYRAEVENFCLSLQGEPSPGTTLDECMSTMNILFAIEDSIRTGTAVSVSAPARH